MDKTILSESVICDKFIRPAMERAGWNGLDQLFRECALRTRREVVRGSKAYRHKGSVLRDDYALFCQVNNPLAVVEAKDNRHALDAGVGQVLHYAQLLDLPFSLLSNGDVFVFHDAKLATGVLESSLTLDEFPSPEELWARYCAWKAWSSERSRVRLVMATGMGKTYTAFQIIWRVWKSGAKKRIHFLADRNILIDQTMVNDFRPFEVVRAGQAEALVANNAQTSTLREDACHAT
jgi:type I restriction enzyme R subunit